MTWKHLRLKGAFTQSFYTRDQRQKEPLLSAT